MLWDLPRHTNSQIKGFVLNIAQNSSIRKSDRVWTWLSRRDHTLGLGLWSFLVLVTVLLLVLVDGAIASF